MNILFVVPGEEHGASMVFAKRQATSLIKEGVCIQMFFLESRTSPVLVWREYLRLKKAISSFRPDIIHAQYGTMTGFICAVCALMTKTKFVITFRGSDLNPSIGVSWIRLMSSKILSQISALYADQIICVSEQLKKRLWFKKKRADVIPTGINLSLFHEIPKDQARRQLGISIDSKVVLFNAGSFRKVKRFDIAQEVIRIVRLEMAGAELLVLKGSINPEEVPFYINASDCLLVTSSWEGSPNIVKEALACNLPVVSVDVGDVRERLSGVIPSAVVDTNDPSDLAKKIVEVLLFPKRSNGREKLKEISEEKIAVAIKKLYERLI